MTNYHNGATFERRIAGILTGHGYAVIRSAGSHSVADLVALKPGEVALLQCKGGQSKIPLPEWNRLYVLAAAVGAVPVLVTRDHIGRVSWVRLLGTAEPRRNRPSAVWAPGELGPLLASNPGPQ